MTSGMELSDSITFSMPRSSSPRSLSIDRRFIHISSRLNSFSRPRIENMLMKYTAQKTENAVRPNLDAMLYFNPVSLWTGTRIICSPIGITDMRVRYDTYIYNVYRPSCVIL